MSDTRGYIGDAHLADAFYLPEKQLLVLYLVSDHDNTMVICCTRSLDPQALLSGFFAPKESISAYDFSGYKIPVSAN